MPECSREFTKYDFFECHFVKSTLRACSAFTKLALLIAVFVKFSIYFPLYSIYFHLILSFYSRQLEFNHLNRVPFTKPGVKNSIFVNFRCAPTAERLKTAHLPVILTKPAIRYNLWPMLLHIFRIIVKICLEVCALLPGTPHCSSRTAQLPAFTAILPDT